MLRDNCRCTAIGGRIVNHDQLVVAAASSATNVRDRPLTTSGGSEYTRLPRSGVRLSLYATGSRVPRDQVGCLPPPKAALDQVQLLETNGPAIAAQQHKSAIGSAMDGGGETCR